jgi:peptide/nickel transport system substrate-binding protein
MHEYSYWQRFSRKRLSRRSALKVGAAGAGAAALALAGCGGDDGGEEPASQTPRVEGTPQPGGNMVIGLGSDPGHLDEQECVTCYWIASQFNGFLFHINLRSQEMMMQMAESFEQPSDTEYVWKLKPGIKFHNVDPVFGREVTADDCVYSFTRRLEDPVSQNDKQLLRDFTARWEALDPLTFKLTTKAPYRPAIDELGNPTYAIIPHEAVEKFGTLAQNPVGCGPYILDKFTRSESVVMHKNPDYFMPGRPYLDSREWVIILDYSTLLQAFKTGQHDYNGALLDKLKVEELQKIDHVVVIKAPNFWRHCLLLRVDRPPLNDQRVWEAIDLAVDRDDLINKMAFGEGKYTGPVPADLEYYSLPQDELRDFYKVDLTKAKELLSAAGYPDGFELDTPVENVTDMTKCAEVVKEHLAKIGVRTNLQPKELGVYLAQHLYASEFEATWYYNLPYLEPDRPLCQYYTRGQAGFSFSKYSNPKMDEWVEKERAEFDNEKRREIILAAQREMIGEHGPQINTYIPQAWAAYWDWVHGPETTVDLGAWSYLGIDVWMTPRT